MPQERRRKLYEILSKQGAFEGTEAEFTQKFSDSNRREKLHSILVAENAFTGTVEEFENKFFADIKKKRSFPFLGSSPVVGEDIAPSPYQGRKEAPEPTQEQEIDISRGSGARDLHGIGDQIRDAKAKLKSRPKQDPAKEYVKFYDSASDAIGQYMDSGEAPDNISRLIYQKWAKEHGGMDRYNYMLKKAASEREVDDGSWDIPKNTTTGLRVWEEANTLYATLLNSKFDDLISRPEVKKKTDTLSSLLSQIQADPSNREAVSEYNELLKDNDIQSLNSVATQSKSLMDSETELAQDFPDVFRARIEKKSRQDAVDAMFRAGTIPSGQYALPAGVAGTVSQLGRSLTGFVSDLVKTPAVFDYDNQYSGPDKWRDVVDKVTDYVDDNLFPIPSKYGRALIYSDAQGNRKMRTDILLPKIAKVSGDMVALLYGAGKISKLGKAIGGGAGTSESVGLFTSSFLQSQEDYRRAGEEAGMSAENAAGFAAASAVVTSALELISPNKYLWSPADMAKRVVNTAATGATKKAAVKEAITHFGTQVLGENLQEVTQIIGDKAVEYGTNSVLGTEFFKNDANDLINEALETMVLTTVVAGAPATVSAARSNSYKDAIELIAEDRDKYMPMLQQSFTDNGSDPEYVRKVMADVDAVAQPVSANPLYKVNGEVVSKDEVKARIESGDTQGLYIANDPILQKQLQEGGVTEPAKVKVETPKQEQGQNKSETEMAQEKAKATIKERIKLLVESGDIAYDGKRVKILTETGGIEFRAALDEFEKSSLGISEKQQQKVIKEGEKHDVSVTKPSPDTGAGAVDVTKPGQTQVESVTDVDESIAIEDFVPETEDTKRVVSVLGKAKTALSKLSPGLNIRLYRGQKQGLALMNKLGAEPQQNARGFYDRASNTIAIDLDAFDSSTPFHEAIHPVIDALKQNNPEVFNRLSEEAGAMPLEYEDGTKTTYGEAYGNNEEALVDFLADFSDGVFDKSPTVMDRVRDIINKILEAVGLKSGELDLDNISSLKDLADTVAEAISKGKVINVSKTIERRGTSPQRKLPKRKLNRTIDRVIKDKHTEFKQFQAYAATHKDEFKYEPQSIKEEQERLSNLTSTEIEGEIGGVPNLIAEINADNHFAVLRLIELIKKQTREGKDTTSLFKKLRELGTGIGQLLRQFQELRAGVYAPDVVADLVKKTVEAQGLTQTEENINKLKVLVQEHVDAINNLEKARTEFYKDSSSSNDKKVLDAFARERKAFARVGDFAGNLSSFRIDSLFPVIMQGNALVPKSIMVNVGGNVFAAPVLMAEGLGGDLARSIADLFSSGKMRNPLLMFGGSAWQWLKHITLGFVPATKRMRRYRRDIASDFNYDATRRLRPVAALKQLLTAEGRSTLPRSTSGKVPFSVYFSKLVEGTLGIPPAIMFELLRIGDAPFKEAGFYAAAFREYVESGTKKSFNEYVDGITPEQRKRIDKKKEESTFSHQGALAKSATSILNVVSNLPVTVGGASHDSAVASMWKTFVKANSLFVTVPANLIQYTAELAIPELAFAQAAWQFLPKNKRFLGLPGGGNPRRAGELITRGLAGLALQVYLDSIIEAGLVVASTAGDDDDERSAKFLKGGPNRINITGFYRFLNGVYDGDEPQDKYKEFSKLGPLGMFLGYRAELYENVKKETGMAPSDLDYAANFRKKLSAILGASMELSFMQSLKNIFDAAKDSEYGIDGYFTGVMDTFSLIVAPNTVSVFGRSNRDTILRAKDTEPGNELAERVVLKFKDVPGLENIIKHVPALKDAETRTYPVVSVFGDLVPQNKDMIPGSAKAYMSQFLDITKSYTVTDPVVVEVLSVTDATGDLPFSAPSPRLSIKGEDESEDGQYTMPELDHVHIQRLAGRLKKTELLDYIRDPDINGQGRGWDTMTATEKLEAMKDINKRGNATARKYLKNQVLDAIENGSVILNSEAKKKYYQYLEPGVFDADLGGDLFE